MAENEYPLQVPLVDYIGDERKVIGTAEIDGKGEVIMTVTDEEYQRALQPPPWNFIGLAGLTREVLEADAEDHIIRGTD